MLAAAVGASLLMGLPDSVLAQRGGHGGGGHSGGNVGGGHAGGGHAGGNVGGSAGVRTGGYYGGNYNGGNYGRGYYGGNYYGNNYGRGYYGGYYGGRVPNWYWGLSLGLNYGLPLLYGAGRGGYYGGGYYGGGYYGYPYYGGSYGYPYYSSGYSYPYYGSSYDYQPYYGDVGPSNSSAGYYNSGTQAPAPSPQPNVVSMAVRVPPNATLWIEGQRMNTQGEVRSFYSSPLEPGQTYTYHLKATWTDPNGQPVERTKAVDVHAGQRLNVDFQGS